jgi:hypothetical protein
MTRAICAVIAKTAGGLLDAEIMAHIMAVV